MKWYVLNYDFNLHKAYEFNIFDSVNFLRGVNEAIKVIGNREEFKDKIDRELKYSFWSKCEYEIYVTDAFHDAPNEISKIDVYDQVKPNLDILVDYIIANLDTEDKVKAFRDDLGNVLN